MIEAFERAKAAYGTGAYDDATLEFLFPELKESEDERIRDWLITQLQNNYKGNYWATQAIDYLKKQKDASKAIETVDRIDKYIDEHLANAHDMKDSNPDKKYYLGWDDALGEMARILQDVYSEEKQKEQKPVEYLSKQKVFDIMTKLTNLSYSQLIPINSDEYKKIYEITSDVRSLLDYPIKPTEWSEEYREEDIQTRFAFYTYKDDPSVLYLSNVFVEETSRNHGFGTRILKAAEKVAEAIGATTICLKVKQDSPANAWYRKNGYGYVAFENGYDWLEKNLEYMKPNKPVEWSEEDEEMLNSIIKVVYGIGIQPNGLREKQVRFLKSLRPQPHKSK